MKKKLKTKYLAGGPPQNSYFGMSRDNTMAMSNLDSVSRGVAGAVSSLNQSQEQQQLDSFKNVANSAMSMIKKKGGFIRKFQTAGACPAGLAWDRASGQCLPDPNWAGSTPGLGVLAEEYLPGMQAAWEGEFQPTDLLAEQKDTGITKIQDISGSILLKNEYLTDPNTINALQGSAPIVGNIAKQAKRAGKVTDLVEQGVPMASNKINLTGALPGAGLVGAGLAAMATNMTSDKNAATFTRGEKAGTYASGIISGAASGASKFGLLGAVGGGIMGAFGAKNAAREAENVAKGIRREEEALGVASREASKNSWQGQESGFAYKGSTNMNMQGTGARRMKSGGVKRVPGGLIVPIKGTNAVEYIGNKHSESTIDGVSGIRIGKKTEVEHEETKQPVQMAKAGGADSSKGKMRDYFFSAYLKLGGKSFAQRHKEILAGGGSKTKIQALVQKLAQQQEAVANQNGEKDRSPDTIASPNSVSKKYGGIHMYQTAGEKEEETKDETAATPETFYEFPVENAGDETLYYNGIALKATPSLDYNGNPIESQFSTPATDVGDPNKRYMRPGISRPERSGAGRKLDTNSGPWSLVDKIGGRGVFRRGNETVGASDVYEAYDPTDTPDSERSVRRHSYLKNQFLPLEEEMKESDYSNLAPIKPLNGVKPETAVNADGSVTVSGVQANNPVKEIGPDGKEIFRVYDDNGVVIGESSVSSVAKSKAQNELIARESKKAKTAAEPNEDNYGQNSMSLDDMVEMDDGSYVTKEEYEKSMSGVKPAGTESKSNNFDTSKVLLEELGYMKGKELDEKMSDGRTRRQHLEDKLKSGDKKKVEEANYEMSLLGANDETFENSTPEASANAQSNDDASNVTVRDQNQANAESPSAQESKAPGATSNNAGQAAVDAAAKAGTQDTTATTTSEDGTPVTSSTTTTSKSGTATTGNTGAPADKRAKLLEETQPIAAWEKPAQTKGKLGSTPRESIKSGIWSGDNYDKEWKPLVEETMADTDLAKKVYDYLTTYQGPSDEVAAVKKRITDDPTTSIKSIIENATDGDVGPFHNAVLNAIKSVQPKPVVEEKKEVEVEVEKEKEVETKKEPCPEGTFRSQSGECLPIPKNITTKSYWSKTAGLSQYLAPVWALLNPYEKTRGMAGVPTASAGPNPRVNLNQERATEREENIAMTNMVRNQSGIQAAIGQSFNNKQNASMLKIAQQEGNINKALIADEQDRAAKVSMFNVQNEVERQKFNRALAKEENQYAREDKLAALQQIGLVTAGNYRDMMMYEATERLADAMQIGGEYTRRKFYEALKSDPAFKGMSDMSIKEFANAYYNLTERPYERTNANESTRNVQKLGGTRRYTSRLGELTKRKSLKFSK